jgi:putative hydrolase of the HAD superfamily
MGNSDLPRAILFDLDDTLIVAGDRPLVLLAVARVFAGELAPLTPEQVADRLEAALAAFWSDPERHRTARFGIPAARLQVFSEVFAATGALTDELAARLAARFTALREELTDVVPGALETIETLKRCDVRLALVTNGGTVTQRAKIARFALEPLFDHIQIEGEHAFGKPDERSYRHAMAVLGVQPGETWMVGDNLEWEVAAPQKLGIFAVWFDGFGRGLPKDSAIRPDRIIRTLPELLD